MILKQLKVVLLFVFSFLLTEGKSQNAFNNQFDADEFQNLLCIHSTNIDSTYPVVLQMPAPRAKLIFRSEPVGLDNRWDYWVDYRGVGIISIRGTAASKESWLGNFYAAMVPATGNLQLSKTTSFKYQLAKDSNALVHVGWLLGLSAMADDIVATMRQKVENGTTEFIIMGHSQGAALAFLLRSYLEYLPEPLPYNVRIKTYGSAAPKPGNLYYAYDFDKITANGWAFRVINPMDWVPEMPFSIQRVSDLNEVNPLNLLHNKTKVNTDKKSTKTPKIPWITKVYVKHTVKKLDRKTRRAQKAFTRTLGEKTYKLLQKDFQELPKPDFSFSMNYSTCGTPIILQTTDNYFNSYLQKADKHIFTHHMYEAYLYLLMQNYPQKD